MANERETIGSQQRMPFDDLLGGWIQVISVNESEKINEWSGVGAVIRSQIR